jgi:hypothetical protein
MRAGAIALYEEAMREQATALVLRTADGRALPLQVSRWCGPPDATDEEMLRHCRGPVLDVGCGPGRLTVALTERGIPVLGVDISLAAVARVRQAGHPPCAARCSTRCPGSGGGQPCCSRTATSASAGALPVSCAAAPICWHQAAGY